MNNTTFPLIKNLIVPATGNPSKGYLLFPAQQFGLSYDVTPRPKQQQIDITLTVADIATNETVWVLGIYKITEAGFPHLTNEFEYTTYLQTIQAKQSEVDTLNAILEDLNNQLQNDQSVLEAYEQAALNWQTAFEELQSIPKVELQYEYVNKYSDVIDYFKGDGTLTEEGIAWAKQVTFLGEPLSNYID